MSTLSSEFEEYDPSLGSYEDYQQCKRLYDEIQKERSRITWERDRYKLAYRFNVWNTLLKESQNLRALKGRASATRKQRTRTRLKRTLGEVQDAVMNHGFND